MLSKTSIYGIKATIFIAQSSRKNERVGVKVIADAIDAPPFFVGKIAQTLAKAKIIDSTKGPGGGFEMNVEQRKTTTIRTIVEILDGGELYTGCGLGLKECGPEKPCPIHHQYAAVRNRIIKLHTRESIEDMSKKLDLDLVSLR